MKNFPRVSEVRLLRGKGVEKTSGNRSFFLDKRILVEQLFLNAENNVLGKIKIMS